jgi:glycogen(starch) synthase
LGRSDRGDRVSHGKRNLGNETADALEEQGGIWTTIRALPQESDLMKVALVTSSYLPYTGGLQLAVHEIAKRISVHGHNVTVFVGVRRKPSSRSEVIDGIQVHGLAIVSPFDHATRLPRLLRFVIPLIARTIRLAVWLYWFKVDVVHVHFVSETALYAAIACAIIRVPFVMTVHGSDLGLLSQASRYKQASAKLVLRRAAAVTAVSRDLLTIARTVESSVSSKSQTIYNGVDVAFFDQWKKSPPLIEYPYLLAIGNLEFVKGHDILIRSIKRVVQEYPEHRLIIAGGGIKHDELVALADELGITDHTLFWGPARRIEVARLLHGCDLLVMPSRKEGFGIAVIEAYACGKAVVASRVGGLVELVRDGKTGVLVEPEHENALADAIISLLSDPQMRADMGKAGRQIVEDYDWEVIIDKYLEVLSNAQHFGARVSV